MQSFPLCLQWHHKKYQVFQIGKNVNMDISIITRSTNDLGTKSALSSNRVLRQQQEIHISSNSYKIVEIQKK
jgi:hypothetical protein